MKIHSIASAIPARRVTTREVVTDIKRRSRRRFRGELSRAAPLIERYLRKSGSDTRAWCAAGETPLKLTLQACNQALDERDDRVDPDLIIVASVYKMLIEPSTANFIASELGLHSAEAWDLTAACDGWMKAVRLAQTLLGAGIYRRIMIVNSEFVMRPGFGIYPELFRLGSLKELGWKFPAFTLGEGAAAVILGPDPDNPWHIVNETSNHLVGLCSIVPEWDPQDTEGDLHALEAMADGEEMDSNKLAQNGLGRFSSSGTLLFKHGFPGIMDLIKKVQVRAKNVDVMFTHSSSYADWRLVAQEIGLLDQFYDIYRPIGNVVSAAVPVAMVEAIKDGTLNAGDRVLATVASAGMTFSVAQFTYR